MRLAAAMLSCVLAVAEANAQTPREIRMDISPGVTIVGDLYEARNSTKPPILLFHQGGGDARGEYASIIPRLLRAGHTVLATDVRGGGNRFGYDNRASQTDASFRYCDARADVDGAVDMARANGLSGPLVLWGSSYTGALVIQVAAQRSSDIAAVLSFSPAWGEPMKGCESEAYALWLKRSAIPLLVVRPSEEMKIPEISRQLSEFRRAGATTFVAQGGSHGSSVLVDSRFQGDTGPQWAAVWDLLGHSQSRRTAAGKTPVSVASDGWQLRGDLARPKAGTRKVPAVLLLHKLSGGRSVYRELSDRLVERDIAAFSLDLRGHGESVNLGRFMPALGNTEVLQGTERDVAAALEALRRNPAIDPDRIAIVSASYSAEAAAIALRHGSSAKAVVAMSPGSFSSASFASLDSGGSAWLFVRGNRETLVREWLDEKVRAQSKRAEIWVAEGLAHGSDLLLSDSTLATRLADWLALHLADRPTGA